MGNTENKDYEATIMNLRGKQVLLYGAKYLGDFAYKLLKWYDIMPSGYVVSDSPTVRILNDLPIYSLKELHSMVNDDTVILLSLNQKYHGEVLAALRSEGLENVCLIDLFSNFNFYEYFFRKICSNIFRQHGIDITGEIIKIGKYQQINPYRHSGMNTFFIEAMDIILPPFFSNYDYVVEGPYEHGAVQLEKDDIVFDCGAHMGIFSCYAASKGCTAYAFEPLVEESAGILEKHAFLHPLIKSYPYALADRCESMTINVSPVDLASSLVIVDDSFTSATVQAITIDQFVADNSIKRVDFIKADIEGAERLMLAGATETLRRFAPKLAICTYHHDDDPQVLEQIIKAANPRYNIVHKWKKLYANV